MLRKFLTGGVAASALMIAVPAFAADMPAPTYTPPPMAEPAPAPFAYDWTGVYVGINAGYAWGEYGVGDPDFGGFSMDGDGALIGGTVGANWQVDQFVFGIEGDLSWADMDGSTAPAPGVVVNAENKWFGTVRGRLGFAVDQILIYGTGGAAFTSVDAEIPGLGSDSNTHVGWTLGAGIEAALTENISAKAEYLYADFGSEDYTIGGAITEVDYDAHVVRAGLNYRFSW